MRATTELRSSLALLVALGSACGNPPVEPMEPTGPWPACAPTQEQTCPPRDPDAPGGIWAAEPLGWPVQTVGIDPETDAAATCTLEDVRLSMVALSWDVPPDQPVTTIVATCVPERSDIPYAFSDHVEISLFIEHSAFETMAIGSSFYARDTHVQLSPEGGGNHYTRIDAADGTPLLRVVSTYDNYEDGPTFVAPGQEFAEWYGLINVERAYEPCACERFLKGCGPKERSGLKFSTPSESIVVMDAGKDDIQTRQGPYGIHVAIARVGYSPSDCMCVLPCETLHTGYDFWFWRLR